MNCHIVGKEGLAAWGFKPWMFVSSQKVAYCCATGEHGSHTPSHIQRQWHVNVGYVWNSENRTVKRLQLKLGDVWSSIWWMCYVADFDTNCSEFEGGGVKKQIWTNGGYLSWLICIDAQNPEEEASFFLRLVIQKLKDKMYSSLLQRHHVAHLYNSFCLSGGWKVLAEFRNCSCYSSLDPEERRTRRRRKSSLNWYSMVPVALFLNTTPPISPAQLDSYCKPRS